MNEVIYRKERGESPQMWVLSPTLYTSPTTGRPVGLTAGYQDEDMGSRRSIRSGSSCLTSHSNHATPSFERMGHVQRDTTTRG